MLMLRSSLQLPEITDEIYRRFETADEEAALRQAHAVTAVATKGDIGLPRELMERLPSLKMICVYGVGVDQIDLVQARERGISITTTPDVLTHSVAEQALALILASARLIVQGDYHIRHGNWANGKLGLGYSLQGRTLGILGYGRIGQRIAALARPFGMKIIYSNLSPIPGEEDAFRTSPEDLAQDADIVVIAAAGGPDTDGLVDAKVLSALGSDGLLVNVARGSIVNEPDLIKALETGNIKGAALDVFENEPTPRAAFSHLPNTVLTPHLSSATVDARQAMGRLVIDNLTAFFEGRPLCTPLEF